MAAAERLHSLLAKYERSTLSSECDLNTALLNLEPGDVARQQGGLEVMRRELDAAGRLARAEEYKALSNSQFGAGEWLISLVGYLASIWMLRVQCQPPPLPCAA
jgi:hypothetical protein